MSPSSDEILLENQKPGTPESEWSLNGPPSSAIEGFTSEFSVNAGDAVSFKVNTLATEYRIEVYRLGYYGGDGARLVATIDHQGAENQPESLYNPVTGLVDAGNWSVTDTWSIPSDAVSGVYLAKLVRTDGVEGENIIPFVVRDDDGQSDIVFQTSDTTWQAYNDWGGNSLYVGDGLDEGRSADRAFAVSYNRPFSPTIAPENFLFGEDYAALRWLEQNGYDVSYISGIDSSRSGDLLLNHEIFLSVGHDEYWSGEQRANVEAARDAGVNLAFWGGNDVYWKTRWEPSLDGSATDYRTLITYKESRGDAVDPSSEWTGLWRQALWSAGEHLEGVFPENALTGTIFAVNSYRSDTINVGYDYSQLRFWANTNIATLKSGESISLAPGTLGYEWNISPDDGFRPDGLINLSSTTVFVNTLVTGPNDSSSTSGDATHNLTLYRAPSGALVFSAGTVFWSWNLDSHHIGPPIPVDRNAQQAMVNLFADMGVQPLSLQAELVLATQTSDHTAPQAAFMPLNLSGPVEVGQKIALHGTATDLGGGVVAAVEVSADAGATWHSAAGSTDWTYIWRPQGDTTTLAARAVDDSLNVGTAFVATVTVDTIDFAHVGFDWQYYLSVNKDAVASELGPHAHYATYGWQEGHNPNAIFSVDRYLAANRDVADAGIDPLDHYHSFGWQEGRDPSFNFDTQLYLLHNADVKAAGIDPLVHYLTVGQAEGRQTYAAIGSVIQNGFDAAFYVLSNADVGKAGVDPYQHYLEFGWREGRNPNAYFDTNGYLSQNPDVAAAGMNPLVHYDLYGWTEDRDPSVRFDTESYEATYTDVAAAQIDPLQHFLQYGALEGRSPFGDGIGV